jgi:hypothetical protein
VRVPRETLWECVKVCVRVPRESLLCESLRDSVGTGSMRVHERECVAVFCERVCEGTA